MSEQTPHDPFDIEKFYEDQPGNYPEGVLLAQGEVFVIRDEQGLDFQPTIEDVRDELISSVEELRIFMEKANELALKMGEVAVQVDEADMTDESSYFVIRDKLFAAEDNLYIALLVLENTLADRADLVDRLTSEEETKLKEFIGSFFGPS